MLESEPYRRLSYAWHSFTPEWAAFSDVADEHLTKISTEPHSKVTFEIKPLGDYVRLSVVHDGFEHGSAVLEGITQGWPMLVASLKSLLETANRCRLADSEMSADPAQSDVAGVALPSFIAYRRLTMKDEARPLDREAAAEYASWFQALADATRIQVVSLLARRGEPMNVGEIVAQLDVSQSTVSAHLKLLADVGFVLADHRGTATYYRINEACVDCFPTAADLVMGRPVPNQPRSPVQRGRSSRSPQHAGAKQ